MIRAAAEADWPAIWSILEPVFRAGETYAIDRDISEDAARALWISAPRATYVAEAEGEILGTYYIKSNHACNCGYVTAAAAQGRGIASAMCRHSLEEAPRLGYRAMQYNLVLASNDGAVRLWQKLGFEIVGTLPAAFDHKALRLV